MASNECLFAHWIRKGSDHVQDLFPEENYLRWTENIADCLDIDGRYQEAEVIYMKLMRIHQRQAGTASG